MPRKKKEISEVVVMDVLHEEEVVGIREESSSTEQSIWRRLSRWSFVLGLALMPFFFVPGAPGLASITQQTVGGVLIISSLIFFLFDSLRERRIPFSSLSRGVKIFSLIFFIGVSVSLFFSPARSFSFWGGSSFEGGTGLAFLLCLLSFFLGTSLFRERRDSSFLFSGEFFSLFATYLLVVLVNLFFFAFGRPFLGITSNAFNLLGGINAFAIFSGGACVLLIGYLLAYELIFIKKILVTLLAVLSFTFLLLFGNAVIFLISIASLLTLLGFQQSFSLKVGNRFSLGTAFVVLAIAILSFLAITGYRVGSLLNLPAEVAPSFNASLSIATQVLSSNVRSLLVGSGPNTYSSDFVSFKPLSINLTSLWSVDFPGAYSLWLTLLPTLGLVGTLAFLFLCLSIFWQSLHRLTVDSKKGNFSRPEFLLSLGIAFLFISSFFFGFTFPLIIYLFVGLGLLAGFSKNEKEDALLVVTSLRSFFLTLILIAFIVSFAVLGFFLVQRFYASLVMNRSVEVFNRDGNLEKVLQDVSVAHRIFPQEATAQLLSTLWQRSLVLSLGEGSSSLATVTPQDSFNLSVSSAQEAIRLNPINHQNWALLGDIYQNVVSIEGASDQAIRAYAEAERVNPTNPFYPLVLARLQILSADRATSTARINLLATAEEELQRSIHLKPNMVESNALLGQLYYTEGKLDQAELLFTQALEINPGFSDARYLLALLYKKQGKLEEARENFNEVLRLNPGNEEVLSQLNSLKDSKK